MTSASGQTVSRDDFALLVIDPQEKLASRMARRAEVVANTVKLIRLAALVTAPVIATRQYPKGLGDLDAAVIAELDALADEDAPVEIVDKLAFCACREPAFLEAVADAGRSQMVIVGMETHICVTQTALALAERGYAVQVVADACSSQEDEAHSVALARLRAAGIVVTVSESVMYEAVPEAGNEEFRGLLRIVKGE